MLSIAVKYSIEIYFCQSAVAARESTADISPSEGWTGHTKLVGKAAAVFRAKAEEDKFSKLQRTATAAFSLGHQKMKRITLQQGLSVASLHGRSSPRLSTQYVDLYFSSAVLSNTAHEAAPLQSLSCVVSEG